MNVLLDGLSPRAGQATEWPMHLPAVRAFLLEHASMHWLADGTCVRKPAEEALALAGAAVLCCDGQCSASYAEALAQVISVSAAAAAASTRARRQPRRARARAVQPAGAHDAASVHDRWRRR